MIKKDLFYFLYILYITLNLHFVKILAFYSCYFYLQKIRLLELNKRLYAKHEQSIIYILTKILQAFFSVITFGKEPVCQSIMRRLSDRGTF